MDRVLRGAALTLLIGLALAGCASRPVGDFGRAAPSPLNDTVMPLIGDFRASQTKGEAHSSFNLTDQEREMRDRVWRYLVAPHAYDWFGDVAVEFQRTRILPMRAEPLRSDLYHEWLRASRHASSRVRYARVREDALADIAMMPAVFRSICAVLEVDRQRGVAVREVTSLGVEDRRNAEARRTENRVVIDWFVRSAANRYASFSHALDRLLVETPHEEAVALNATLTDLAGSVEAAERGDFCGDGGQGGGRAGDTALRSRSPLSAPDEERYRK